MWELQSLILGEFAVWWITFTSTADSHKGDNDEHQTQTDWLMVKEKKLLLNCVKNEEKLLPFMFLREKGMKYVLFYKNTT